MGLHLKTTAKSSTLNPTSLEGAQNNHLYQLVKIFTDA
jgi:hypothetical protein